MIFARKVPVSLVLQTSIQIIETTIRATYSLIAVFNGFKPLTRTINGLASVTRSHYPDHGGFGRKSSTAWFGVYRNIHGWIFLNKKSRPISRVLSWATIHLGNMSPCHSCSLPESSASRTIGFLFGLAPSGVYHAMECCHPCGGLLPHHFTLTSMPIKTSEAVYFLLHFP